MRRKEAEFKVRSLQLSTSSPERFLAEQTVPDTEITETFIKNATKRANPLSIR